MIYRGLKLSLHADAVSRKGKQTIGMIKTDLLL